MEQSSEKLINANHMDIPDIKPFFKIDTAWIEDDFLKIKISFIGNKNIPEFSLVWNGALMKSLPPKAVLVLLPKIDKLPKGKKTVKMTLAYELSAIKETNYDEIILLLKDYNTQLRYTPKK